MSRSATEFVRPLTFQALTYRPVEVEMFQIRTSAPPGTSRWAGRRMSW